MLPRDPRAPATWHEAAQGSPPFARFFDDPSENPTVRPTRAEGLREDPTEALLRAENLVLIARRARPIHRVG